MKMLTSSFEQEGEIFPVALEKLTVELQMVRLCPPLGFFVNLITNSWLYVWPKEIIETNINIESKMYLKYKDPPPFWDFFTIYQSQPCFLGVGDLGIYWKLLFGYGVWFGGYGRGHRQIGFQSPWVDESIPISL